MSNYNDKIVELRADVHAVWRLQCQNLYNSKNLAALAVRECFQNSLDSVKAALKAGIVAQGRISIGYDGDTIWVEDNGIGMDIPTIHDKFLTLGGTTKGDEDNVGGFGLAKSVILGCGTGFKVETQDNVFTSDDLGKRPIQKQAYRQGTKITCYGAQVDTDKRVSDELYSFKFAVEDYVLTSDIPKNIKVDINGREKPPTFKFTKRTLRMPVEFGIGDNLIPDNTDLIVNVFKNKTSGYSYLYVRLRGLTQFKCYLSWNAGCDIVLDFDTRISPRDPNYPFATNREGLKAHYQGIVEAIRSKMSQSPLSIERDTRYKETIYDNVDDGSAASSKAAKSMVETLTSEQVVGTVLQVAAAVSDIRTSGMTPQGGFSEVTLADYLKQYSKLTNKISEKSKVPRTKLAKYMSDDTMFQLNNPLSHSWIIYEDREWKHSRLSASKIVSMTVIWDAILRLMANNCDGFEDIKFYPGVVLEKGVSGLCLEKLIRKGEDSEMRRYVMVNPLTIPEGNMTKIALFIMGVAAHELAHLKCGVFQAHGETFAYTREYIMNQNLDALDSVISIITKSKIKNILPTSQKYKNLTMEQLTETAKEKGINVEELRAKYPNDNIFRMRLTMALKK